MTCVQGLVMDISSISLLLRFTHHSSGNRLELDLIQQPSLKHDIMSLVTGDVSNMKDFESYEIGLGVCG